MTDGRHTIWTAEVISTLNAGVSAKMSASAIATMIAGKHNVAVTRNAVIGKMNRSGAPVYVRKIQAPRERRKAPASPPPSAAAAPPPTLRDNGFPHTLLTLPARACKWPVAGARKNMQFCAHETPQSGASPYCAHHHQKSIMRTTLPGEA